MENAEQDLISAVLKKKDHTYPASNGITLDLFHSYPDEWKWIERYVKKHKRTPSKAAFRQKFPKFKITKSDDVEHFCDEVRRGHTITELTIATQDVLAELQDGHVEDAVKSFQKSAMTISARQSGTAEDSDILTHWQDTYDEVMRRVARQSTFGQAGIPTGFPTLDERTGGPQPGQVWIIAARLGQGKTWSLVRMAMAAAFSGHVVQYNALEGSRAEISMRVHTFASSEYGQEVFKNMDLAQGRNFSPRKYKEFLQGLSVHAHGGRFHVGDTSNGPVSNLSMAAQIERNQPDIVFLDYITLMDGDSGTSSDDWKSIGKLSKGLKQNSERYQVATVAAAQLNRQAAADKLLAGPEKLAESDAIGRDADAVVTMAQLSKTVLAAKLAKYRHGRDGYIWYMRFLPNTGHFEEITQDEARDISDDEKDAEGEQQYIFKPRKKGSFAEIAEKKKLIVPGQVISSSTKKVVVKKKKAKK